MRKILCKSKGGKVLLKRTTKKGKQVITTCRGQTTRGKKNLKLRKPQRKRKGPGLAAFTIK